MGYLEKKLFSSEIQRLKEISNQKKVKKKMGKFLIKKQKSKTLSFISKLEITRIVYNIIFVKRVNSQKNTMGGGNVEAVGVVASKGLTQDNQQERRKERILFQEG